ncbi:hypothetical protein [Mesorhizobium sp. WSM2561]|uniref:hypothetical protein n=1 Tax=Mesorhizobium sp. WSM2561 TaxID=1040985 RepID=UPI0018DB5247|nr:hypothetical protein [Mesorhizobium sp. WSM2561]
MTRLGTRKAALRALGDVVSAAMGTTATGMAGVIVKAQALEAWGRQATVGDTILYDGATDWGSDFANSILRMAKQS